MGLTPAAQGGKKTAPFSIRRINNGWEVSRSWEKRTPTRSGQFNYEYFSETFAYPTLEKALEKVEDLA